MNNRFYSLDVFRGITVAFMILVNNAGNWDFIYEPLEHASWHGWTPTDLVFPFFLFAMGNALAFVIPKLETAGNAAFLRKTLKRSVIIFGIGLFLNWFPFVRWSDGQFVFRYWVNPQNPEFGVRILGVLQRIALCYLFASLIIYYGKIRVSFIVSIILLLGYWVLCLAFGQAGDPYSLQGYFGTCVDKAILGVPHLYRGEHVAFDPEGLASTIPAIAETIFGYLVGNYIVQKGKSYETTTRLFVAGCLLVFAGYCWNMVFPINKKIWTSSYVLFTSGLATLLLAILVDRIELNNHRGRWTKFFDVFGKNPLFIYFLSGFIPRVLGLIHWQEGTDEQGKPLYITPLPWFYEHVCKPVSDNLKNGSLLYAICIVLFFWAIAFWMDRRKLYVRV
ncbi:MAG TPA: heparan-alpha-glucosaminide N-acetyltransferase domain-containing protein [Puia sp.]|nr:heparan-alpha-glucosaminide N-acetyltransferase domain-containing protein [Puia sp.]